MGTTPKYRMTPKSNIKVRLGGERIIYGMATKMMGSKTNRNPSVPNNASFISVASGFISQNLRVFVFF